MGAAYKHIKIKCAEKKTESISGAKCLFLACTATNGVNQREDKMHTQ